MLRESAQGGRFDLKGFYLRRAVRILPVYAAFLIAVGILQVTTAYHQHPLQWFYLLTFTSNVSSVPNWLTGHIWSLSCEEQFYLIWPVLFLLLRLAMPRRAGWVTFLIILLLWPISRVASYLKLGSGFLNFIVNLDTLAIGCLLAYVHPWIGKNLFSGRIKAAVAIPILLIAWPYVLSH